MSHDDDRVGDNVTRETHIAHDGRHAFYAGGQTYAGAEGTAILEMVTTEMLHWVTHDDGRTTLDACYDGTWVRRSEDNGSTWEDVEARAAFDTTVEGEQLLPCGMSLDERTDTLVRFYRGQKADKSCYGYINQGAYRVFYAISTDQGATWSDVMPIVDRRGGFDERRWGPELDYGTRGAILNGAACRVVRSPAPSVPDIYAAADAVVFTSIWEGFGNPPIEAAVWHRPAIVSHYPVAEELRQLGFEWFDPDNLDPLRQHLAAGDEDLLGHNRRVVEQHLSMEVIGTQVADLLADMGIHT